MKQFLFFIGLLITLSLFIPEEEINNVQIVTSERKAVMEKKNCDIQHTIEILSKEMKDSNCLVPRRNIQNISHAYQNRTPRNAFRIIQDIRLKDVEQLQKVLEYNSNCQITKLSTLLCRNAYHVFALRKLII